MYSTDIATNNNFRKKSRINTLDVAQNFFGTCLTESASTYSTDFTEYSPISFKDEMKEYLLPLKQLISLIKPQEDPNTSAYESSTISNSLNSVSVSPEIKEIKNKYFNRFLNEILSEIYFQLTKFEQKDNVEISVQISRDLEVPDWNEFVITIKLLSMDYISYERFFELWKEIDESVRERIYLIRDVDKEVLEKYGKPVIVLEEAEN